MNINQPSIEVFDELGRQYAHETRQQDIIGTIDVNRQSKRLIKFSARSVIAMSY